MRMLFAYPFWRWFLSVGISIVIVVYLDILQPYYTFASNFISTLQWSIYGSLRFCLEIGYLFETSMNTLTPVFVFIGIGVLLSISVIIFNFLIIKLRRRKMLLLKYTKKYIKIKNELKKTWASINKHELKYEAIKRHKQDSWLYFNYANFLAYYRKNYRKAQNVYKQARLSNPSLFLRFVLFCKTKESGRGTGESDGEGGSGSELQSLAAKALIASSSEHHEKAKQALKSFFENMTLLTPIYSYMADHLHTIVEEEKLARQAYEELLVMNGQNVSVLRNYAKLLIDIYQDEDTCDMLLQRADRFEEENACNNIGQGYDNQNTTINNKEQLHAGNESHKDYNTFSSAKGEASADPQEQQNDQTDCSKDQQSQQIGQIRVNNKKNKKKKQKKEEDSSINEIKSGSSNSSLGMVIGGLLFVAHILAIIIYCISMAIYLSQADSYQVQLQNLKRICDLATFSTELATLAQMYLIHEFEYNFSYPGSQDGLAGVVRPFDNVKERLKQNADSIVQITSNIYEMTTITLPWEESSLEAYIFQTGDTECINTNGQIDQCKGDINAIHADTTSLIQALTQLAQKSQQLSDIKGDPHQISNYHSDISYITFNSLNPVLGSSKRAMVEYWQDTNNLTSQILIIFIVVIAGIMIFELLMLVVIYVLFSVKIIRDRKNAFQQVFEVPKQKMQAVIRRLLQ
ncbi:MAG: hypothetical protein EZS28_018705, partial [Streblomastix strix]